MLFRDLPPDVLDALEGVVERREVPGGEYLSREGEDAEHLFWVEDGSVALLKCEPGRDVEHHIDTVRAGDCIGELGLIDGLPRSTSARAETPCVIWALPFHRINPDAAPQSGGGAGSVLRADAHQRLVSSLAHVLTARLRNNVDASLETAREHAALGKFTVSALLLLVFYLVVVSALPSVHAWLPSSTSYVSIPLQIVFGIASIGFIRSTGYPLSRFGLGFRHMVGSLFEAVVFTLPFLGLVTAIKWGLLWLNVDWVGPPLIEHPNALEHLRQPEIAKLAAIYAVASAVQELIVRGAVQSSLETFLTGRFRVGIAIIVSGVLFAALHIHMHFYFAALAFVPGVFWGWLFSRRRNLAGVTLSHIAVGVYVFFILGVSPP